MCSVEIKAEDDDDEVPTNTEPKMESAADQKQGKKRAASVKKAEGSKFLTRKTFTGKCKWCDQGGYSIEQIFGLSFGLKNGLRFHFDSKTCLNYPFLNIFLVWGNLKPKLE